VTEQLHQWEHGDIGDGANARRRTERAHRALPPPRKSALEDGERGAVDRRQHLLFEIGVRDQAAAKARNHRRCSGQIATTSRPLDAAVESMLRNTRSSASSSRAATASRAAASASGRRSKSER
jgi:hypothetical protein